EHETDLAGANSDVACWNVSVLSDVTIQFGHECLTEAHDFAFGASGWVEISSAFGDANLHAGQRVLEHLLKSEKFHDAQVHGGVEPNATLIRAKCRVEFHAETAVHLDDALVINPGDSENNLTFWLNHAPQNPVFYVFGMALHDGTEAGEDFIDRLEKFGFTRVAAQYFFSNLG